MTSQGHSRSRYCLLVDFCCYFHYRGRLRTAITTRVATSTIMLWLLLSSWPKANSLSLPLRRSVFIQSRSNIFSSSCRLVSTEAMLQHKRPLHHSTLRRDALRHLTMWTLDGETRDMEGDGHNNTRGRVGAMSPMSYEVDSEQNVEEKLGDTHQPTRSTAVTPHPTQHTSGGMMNGGFGTISTSYDSLLTEVGLNDGRLKYVGQLPYMRTVARSDIFCNRELRLGGIRAIGFDMDYTLAQYQQPAFDQLAFDGAKHKLVTKLGYPAEVLDFQYDHSLWTRGLIMDTLRGNFLKIDRHKYVRVAYHGFDKISKTTRKHLYSRTFNKVLSFSEKHFVNMDTLFQFVDAHLFASLIDLKDKGEYDFLDLKTYEELYKNVRECVDLCHRDGVIKDEVARNPDKYIIQDNGLIPMLQRFRQDGVRLFLLTNSLWEYTSTAMNYLYHGRRVDDDRQRDNEWMELFDLVVVGSCKPAYMLDPYLNLFRVNPRDGSLLNTDGVFEIEALNPNGATKFLQKGKCFQGGNWLHLQAMLEIEAGEEILYVGDHLYSDVLRSKRTLGWRSAFIMPELEEEMRVFSENIVLFRQIAGLRQVRDELGLYCEEIRRSEDMNDPATQVKLRELEVEDAILRERVSAMAESWHAAFHPIWGAMFRAGYQDSRFSFYVQNYACLYTSRASNLGLASNAKSFRTIMELLPHDRLLLEPQTQYLDQDPWEHPGDI